MKIEIRRSFVKDAEKLPPAFRLKLSSIISQADKVIHPSEIGNCKKLTGYPTAWRIRMGQYRVGFFFEKGTAEFVRILHRKEMYRYFP